MLPPRVLSHRRGSLNTSEPYRDPVDFPGMMAAHSAGATSAASVAAAANADGRQVRPRAKAAFWLSNRAFCAFTAFPCAFVLSNRALFSPCGSQLHRRGVQAGREARRDTSGDSDLSVRISRSVHRGEYSSPPKVTRGNCAAPTLLLPACRGLMSLPVVLQEVTRGSRARAAGATTGRSRQAAVELQRQMTGGRALAEKLVAAELGALQPALGFEDSKSEASCVDGSLSFGDSCAGDISLVLRGAQG